MPSNAESRIASHLPRLLAGFDRGAEIHDAPELAELLSAMEWFVGEILGEVYPEWGTESLDGIFPHVLRKVGDREIELLGLGILISDQSLVPLHVRLQVDPEGNEVSWLECRLGAAGDDGMMRQSLQAGFACKPLGLSFVAPDKFERFAFLDEDLAEVGALRKILPSKAEYFRSSLCRSCELYIIDFSTTLDRHQAEEAARALIRAG